jgi:hypothetical protein
VPKAIVARWNEAPIEDVFIGFVAVDKAIVSAPPHPFWFGGRSHSSGFRLPIRRDLIFAFRDVPDLLLLHAAVHKPSHDMRGV